MYQNKVNLNLAFTQRLGHQAHNCKMVYYEVQRGHVLLATLKNLSKGSKFCRLNWRKNRNPFARKPFILGADKTWNVPTLIWSKFYLVVLRYVTLGWNFYWSIERFSSCSVLYFHPAPYRKLFVWNRKCENLTALPSSNVKTLTKATGANEQMALFKIRKLNKVIYFLYWLYLNELTLVFSMRSTVTFNHKIYELSNSHHAFNITTCVRESSGTIF